MGALFPPWFGEETRRNGLCERALLRDADAAREARRRGACLAEDEEALRGIGRLAGDLLGDACDPVALRRRPDPQYDEPAGPYERQAPLGCGRRMGERLRHRDAGPV